MEIRTLEKPVVRRGRKGEMVDTLKSLTPNSNKALVIKTNQSSNAYSAAKTAGLSISIHKHKDLAEGTVAVYSNGPRKS